MSEPPDIRASNRERQVTVRALTGQVRDGRMSEVTFVRRLVIALDARRRSELDELMSDLPRRGVRRRMLPVYRRLTGLLSDAVPRALLRRRAAARRHLALPPVPGQYVIGRSDVVDLRLDDISVSRRHALMAFVEGGWVLTDLGSRNGTWVNGWRLPGPARVTIGDLLDIGNCRFVLVDRRGVLGYRVTSIAQ
ncbi:MAG: hypothetical protein QOE03_836 [Micromonosporaceae bacterium]|jgi:hypothetical protein|nr:hypothetical protein [Micromonosporaceae bacterium]